VDDGFGERCFPGMALNPKRQQTRCQTSIPLQIG
jgi:hypothetical protein